MDEEDKQKNTVFSRLNSVTCGVLKPLSVNSMMIAYLGCVVDFTPDSPHSCCLAEGVEKVIVPHNLKCEEALSNPAPDFDYDVDDILCLNPCSSPTVGLFSNTVESNKFPSRHTLKIKPTNPSVAHRQNKARGDWQVSEEQEEPFKRMRLNAKDGEEDKGYFSESYTKDSELEKNLSQSVSPQLPATTSRPLFSMGAEKLREDESQPESPTRQGHQKPAGVSFTCSDLSPIISEPQLESINCPEEPLDGDNEEGWNIGKPIFESSLCQKSSVNLDDSGEQVSEKLKGNVEESIQEGQTTLSLEETTLPLVKVKSVVVAVSRPTTNSKQPSCPEHNTYSTKQSQTRSRSFQPERLTSCVTSQRPLIFNEVDLERKKRLYVHSVTKHTYERPPADPDVVTELQNLMTHVADQIPGTNGGQWQHPSDLTLRNYKKRFGNVKPKMHLIEWQAQNCTTLKRFSRIPKIFERSPFP